MTIKPKHKGGRPKKYIINPVEVEKMASYGVPQKDIADFFNCPPNIISQSYAQFYTKGFLRMKQQLRMKQIQRALQGSDTMLIWLGKQSLGQSDKQESSFDKKTIEAIEIIVKHSR